MVTLPFTVVPTLVVVVTRPPLRFKVVVPLPVVLAKVRVCAAVGVMPIVPPVVDIVAVALSGAVIVRPVAKPPELKVRVEAPVAEMPEPAPRSEREGVLTVIGAPEATLTVWPLAI